MLLSNTKNHKNIEIAEKFRNFREFYILIQTYKNKTRIYKQIEENKTEIFILITAKVKSKKENQVSTQICQIVSNDINTYLAFFITTQ